LLPLFAVDVPLFPLLPVDVPLLPLLAVDVPLLPFELLFEEVEVLPLLGEPFFDVLFEFGEPFLDELPMGEPCFDEPLGRPMLPELFFEELAACPLGLPALPDLLVMLPPDRDEPPLREALPCEPPEEPCDDLPPPKPPLPPPPAASTSEPLKRNKPASNAPLVMSFRMMTSPLYTRTVWIGAVLKEWCEVTLTDGSSRFQNCSATPCEKTGTLAPRKKEKSRNSIGLAMKAQSDPLARRASERIRLPPKPTSQHQADPATSIGLATKAQTEMTYSSHGTAQPIPVSPTRQREDQVAAKTYFPTPS
jgi:hypothetical protein